MLEESGIIEPTENANPAPAPPSRIRNSGQYRFARLGDRFLAFSLDLAVLFGLFAVIDAWVFMRLGTVSSTELQLTTASLLIAITSNALILFLYGWMMEASWGATLGKAIIGIRVVGTSQRGPLTACAVRNVLRIVDGIGFYLVGTVSAACSGTRQRLGDVYAQTAVIEDNFGRVMRVTAFVLWLGILGGAGWAVPRICSSNDSLQTPFFGEVIPRVGRSEHSVYFKMAGMSVNVQLASAEQ
ncbi:MAG: RDD family protein [Candidatus Angelobacter sp.]